MNTDLSYVIFYIISQYILCCAQAVPALESLSLCCSDLSSEFVRILNKKILKYVQIFLPLAWVVRLGCGKPV
jgi:hypothetical protein